MHAVAESYVTCPACGRFYAFDDLDAGAAVACRCGSLFRRPDDAESAAQRDEADRRLRTPMSLRRLGERSYNCPGPVLLAEWVSQQRVRPTDRVSDGATAIPACAHGLLAGGFHASRQKNALDPVQRLLLEAVGAGSGILLYDGLLKVLTAAGREIEPRSLAGAAEPHPVHADVVGARVSAAVDPLRQELLAAEATDGVPPVGEVPLVATVEPPAPPEFGPREPVTDEPAGTMAMGPDPAALTPLLGSDESVASLRLNRPEPLSEPEPVLEPFVEPEPVVESDTPEPTEPAEETVPKGPDVVSPPPLPVKDGPGFSTLGRLDEAVGEATGTTSEIGQASEEILELDEEDFFDDEAFDNLPR